MISKQKKLLIVGSGFGLRVVDKIAKKNKHINHMHLSYRKFKKILITDFKLLDDYSHIHLATPPFTHLEIINNLIDKGFKNKIICEKPLTNNLYSIKKLKNKKYKNLVHISYQLRNLPLVQYLKFNLNKKIGKVKFINIIHYTNLNNSKNHLSSWWYDYKNAGTQTYAVVSHFLDLLLFLNILDDKTKNLKIINRNKFKTHRNKIISSDIEILKNNNNFLKIYSTSDTNIKSSLSIDIFGNESSIKILDFNKLIISKKNKSHVLDFSKKIDEYVNENFWREGIYYYFENVINGKNNFSSIRDGILIHTLINKIIGKTLN